jgi:hypothetical protein
MEAIDDFQIVGKKMPYEEPKDFFEQFSEKTLQQAKQREQSRKKMVVLWRAMAVAASLSALAMLGHYLFEPEKQELHQIVQEKQAVQQQIIPQQEVARQPEPAAEIAKLVPENEPKRTIAKGSDTEEIGEVLADLSDEELAQLAAMYKADLFISESEQ